MSVFWKRLLKPILPSSLIAWRAQRNQIRFTGPYANWQLAAEVSTGYSNDEILQRVAAATRRVVEGTAAYERDSLAFAHPEPDLDIFPILQTLIKDKRTEPLIILDFGGSLGSTYHQHRKFFPADTRVQWHIIEQSHFVKLGTREFQTDELRFHPDLHSALTVGGRPALILMSSVLPYLENPWAALTQLSAIQCPLFVVTRTPFCDNNRDHIVVQHVPPSIYPASYPSWVFSQSRFDQFWRNSGASIEWRSTTEGNRTAGFLNFTYRSAIIHTKREP